MAWADVAAAQVAVERYLQFLEDPTKVAPADGDAVCREFIARGRLWAGAELLSAQAFRELGVPDDVLLAAGIVEERRIRGRRVISVPGF